MGTVERTGDATSDVESGEEEEIVAGGERGAGIRNAMLAALGGGAARGMTADALALPPPVRRRLKALKSLQRDAADVEAKFYTEVHQLECKYAKMYKPLHDKRAEIVNGAYEPTDDECLNPWQEDGDGDEDALAKAVSDTKLSDSPAAPQPDAPAMDPNAKGIPEFWYTIFRNVSMLSEMMQEHDEPIIKCLKDIKVIMHEDPMGFTLEFHFAPNEYFTNSVLTKEYSMKCKPDDENPLDFEGPEIYQCRGCEINWKKGKNVTVKTIKKKQKHKSRGSVRTVTKSVQADSFFNFFNPPPMPDDNNSTLATDIQALLTTDFEIGHYIRERVVSRAVLLYTGEGLDDDDDYDDEEEEEEEECSSEESEEEAPAHKKRSGKRPHHPAHPAHPNHPAAPANPAECKQQ